jgi:hypothetical protein
MCVFRLVLKWFISSEIFVLQSGFVTDVSRSFNTTNCKSFWEHSIPGLTYQNGKYVPNDLKIPMYMYQLNTKHLCRYVHRYTYFMYTKYLYQMSTKYSKWPQTVPSGNKLYQHFPFQGLRLYLMCNSFFALFAPKDFFSKISLRFILIIFTITVKLK